MKPGENDDPHRHLQCLLKVLAKVITHGCEIPGGIRHRKRHFPLRSSAGSGRSYSLMNQRNCGLADRAEGFPASAVALTIKSILD